MQSDHYDNRYSDSSKAKHNQYFILRLDWNVVGCECVVLLKSPFIPMYPNNRTVISMIYGVLLIEKRRRRIGCYQLALHKHLVDPQHLVEGVEMISW